MTIVLKPIHLVLLSFLAGIAIAAGVAVLLFGGSDGEPREVATLGEPGPSTPTGPDEPPTSTPQLPAPTEVPSTEAPLPPMNTPAPFIRSCGEIQAAGDYLNPEERTFFLANCISSPSAPAPAQSAPVLESSTAEETAEEATYRRRASAFMLGAAGRFVQYFGQPSLGYVADVHELGSIAGGWANEMNGLEPVPPRFRQAHDQLRSALYDFSDWAKLIGQVESLEEFYFWEENYVAFWDLLFLAWDDYILVTGVDLPDPPR